MARARKLLLADPDVAQVKALGKALRARGYQVQYAPDGLKALELAVLRHPDVVLFDEKCALIEPKAFTQILHTNPRTEDIVVVVTTQSAELDRFRGVRESVLLKPFNLDEVLSRIDHLCRRVEAARDIRGEAREIEGALSQLPLPDLLQILAMNRRTGKLTLTHGAQSGEVYVGGGRPLNARLGVVEGEKALFRLLGWTQGTFAFQPGPAPQRTLIERAMEDALLEGMRQADERGRLLALLPKPGQVLEITPAATLPVEPHPVTAEVLKLLEEPRRVQEVLDATEAPDLEALGALSTLYAKGVVRAQQAEVQQAPLLGAAEVHSLRGRLMRGKPARNALVAKLVVCGSGPRAGRFALRSLVAAEPGAGEPRSLRSSFGTLGRLDVNEVLKVDLVILPTTEAARPLWRGFATGCLGGLLLEDGPGPLQLARYLGFELRVPVVVAAGNASNGLCTYETIPPALRGVPAGALLVNTDLDAAVRAVLVAAMQTPGAAL